MRSTKTTTLFIAAIVLIVLGTWMTPNDHPAPVPVVGREGTPLLDEAGKPILRHDKDEMNAWYRTRLIGSVSLVGGVGLFVWWLIRAHKISREWLES